MMRTSLSFLSSPIMGSANTSHTKMQVLCSTRVSPLRCRTFGISLAKICLGDWIVRPRVSVLNPQGVECWLLTQTNFPSVYVQRPEEIKLPHFHQFGDLPHGKFLHIKTSVSLFWLEVIACRLPKDFVSDLFITRDQDRDL